MKRLLLLLLVIGVAGLAACADTKQGDDGLQDGNERANEKIIDYELLLHLDIMPHEIGNSMTRITNEALYEKWAEMLRFDPFPAIDFATEEVLVVTAYSNGCGLVMDTLTQQEDTLIVTLNFPPEIRDKKDIICTDIALANTYVMKMPKTGATKGTLKDPYTILVENEPIMP